MPESEPPVRRRPTLRDVAAGAGVSPTTASLILNDRPINVPPETRRRVLDTAAALHYVPNALVRSLQMGRTGTLGVYIQFRASVWQNAFVGALLDGLRSGAAETDHDVLLYQPPEPSKRDAPAAGAVMPLLDGRADAAVLWLSSAGVPLDGLARAGFPAVVLMHDSVPSTLGGVQFDEALASRQVLEHLRGLGHRTLAYVAGAGPTQLAPHLRARRQAFLAAAAGAGTPLARELVAEGTREEVLGQVRALLTRGRLGGASTGSSAARVTAFVCAYEEAAYQVVTAAAELGLRIPEDISLVAWETVGAPPDAAVAPARPGNWLTGVRLPVWAMGRAAAEMAVELLRARPEGSAPRRVFPTDLHLGSSTARVSQDR